MSVPDPTSIPYENRADLTTKTIYGFYANGGQIGSEAAHIHQYFDLVERRAYLLFKMTQLRAAQQIDEQRSTAHSMGGHLIDSKLWDANLLNILFQGGEIRPQLLDRTDPDLQLRDCIVMLQNPLSKNKYRKHINDQNVQKQTSGRWFPSSCQVGSFKP